MSDEETKEEPKDEKAAVPADDAKQKTAETPAEDKPKKAVAAKAASKDKPKKAVATKAAAEDKPKKAVAAKATAEDKPKKAVAAKSAAKDKPKKAVAAEAGSEDKPKKAVAAEAGSEEKPKEDASKDKRKSAGDDVVSVLDEVEGGGDAAPEAKALPKKGTRQVPYGIAHIRATFNNTIVTIADTRGEVLGWSSGGRAGFKGARKSTAFAAGVVGQEAARHALARGVREVEVRVQGPGAGRETAVRALQSSGLTISVIKDVTAVPHNGCRPPKRRRV
jgi:small subunit ribosomal protein S11